MTTHPGRIKAVIDVPLPRPRDDAHACATRVPGADAADLEPHPRRGVSRHRHLTSHQEEDMTIDRTTASRHRAGRIVAAAASSRIAPALGVAGAVAAPRRSCARRRARPIKVSVGRQPWAAGNSPVTQYMIANKTVREVRRGAGLRPHRRLSRLSVGAADGRGVRVGQPRLRHVGQHADRAPDRAEPADPARSPSARAISASCSPRARTRRSATSPT